jgi:uncharacterized protein with ParB-like and HNH nuclease domain
VQPILIDRIKDGSGITAIDPLKQYFIRDNNTLHFIKGKKKVALKVKKNRKDRKVRQLAERKERKGLNINHRLACFAPT